MKKNLNPLYEGWFSNLFKGPSASNIEEAKKLYVNDAKEYGSLGMARTWIGIRIKHFDKVRKENKEIFDVVTRILDMVYKRCKNDDSVESYGYAISGFLNLNLYLFSKYGSVYCDETFKRIVRNLSN